MTGRIQGFQGTYVGVDLKGNVRLVRRYYERGKFRLIETTEGGEEKTHVCRLRDPYKEMQDIFGPLYDPEFVHPDEDLDSYVQKKSRNQASNPASA